MLLDTHALVWAVSQDRRMGRRTRATLDQNWARGAIAVSAISFWEIALLAERGRLRLPTAVDEYRTALLNAGMLEVGLDGTTAIRAVDLHGLPDDPADRFIVATALTHDAVLVTGDERLLAWKHGLERQDARR